MSEGESNQLEPNLNGPATRITSSLPSNALNEEIVLLNQDMFNHMFDFLPLDALRYCQCLSKDICRRAYKRMRNISLIFEYDDIGGIWGEIRDQIRNQYPDYDIFANRCKRRLKCHEGSEHKSGSRNICVKFRDEYKIDVVLDEPIISWNSFIFGSGTYSFCEFFYLFCDFFKSICRLRKQGWKYKYGSKIARNHHIFWFSKINYNEAKRLIRQQEIEREIETFYEGTSANPE